MKLWLLTLPTYRIDFRDAGLISIVTKQCLQSLKKKVLHVASVVPNGLLVLWV